MCFIIILRTPNTLSRQMILINYFSKLQLTQYLNGPDSLIESRASQSLICWHFELNNPPLQVLSGCWKMFSRIPASSSNTFTRADNCKCLSMLPQFFWGQNLIWLYTTDLKSEQLFHWQYKFYFLTITFLNGILFSVIN